MRGIRDVKGGDGDEERKERGRYTGHCSASTDHVRCGMSGAITVERSCKLEASPTAVRASVRCFHAPGRCHPGAIDTHNSIAATTTSTPRLLRLNGGASSAETLICREDRARNHQYRILCSPLPISDCVEMHSVSNAMSGRQKHWAASRPPFGQGRLRRRGRSCHYRPLGRRLVDPARPIRHSLTAQRTKTYFASKGPS